MDELDLRILGSLAWKPGDPAHLARGILRPWDIARALGVHGNTVKTRLEEMRDAGVLRGVYLLPMGCLPEGVAIGVYWLRYDDLAGKREGLRRLDGSQEVSEVVDYVGQGARVGVIAEREARLAEAAERIRALAGADDARLSYRRRFERPPRVTALDVRILAALLHDALRPFSEVAEEVGVTQRTVRLRFRALAAARAFTIIPFLNLGNVAGLIAYELAVEFDTPSPQAHAALLNAFPEAFYRSRPSSEAAYVYLAARTAASIDEAAARARGVPGVRSARPLLVRASWGNPHAFPRMLAARLEGLEGGGPAIRFRAPR